MEQQAVYTVAPRACDARVSSANQARHTWSLVTAVTFVDTPQGTGSPVLGGGVGQTLRSPWIVSRPRRAPHSPRCLGSGAHPRPTSITPGHGFCEVSRPTKA